MKVFVGVLAALTVLATANASTDKVVCYFGSWANYRPGNGKFFVDDIDPFLCTHVIYTFVGLSADGSVRILDPNNEINNGGLRKLKELKNINPKVQISVAIGGWNEGSATYSNVAANDALRANLVNSIVAFTKEHGLDGFDIDWEYPAQRGGAIADKANYIKLLKELRARFDAEGWFLSAAVAAPESYIASSYDVPQMSKYLDFINIMAYDMHGPWDGRTGQNAPLLPSSKDISFDNRQLNVQAAIQGWINAGAIKSKIVLGVPLYGKTFTLSNPSDNGLYAKSTTAGQAGPFTQESGMLGYNEICQYENSPEWTIIWDDEQKVPYMHKDNQWISYDNPESIALKAQFAKETGLGGVMVWSIETDDFRGLCEGGKYPLLTSINSVVFGGKAPEIGKPVATVPSKQALPLI
ncbi:acidic mammalian chitinase-like [Ctenocephalides felis]|uniref:acidic mammalian chitinase-like n=1 Tax=Ctenocephalides felis TaxID=7515 RepID=UPI000E6E3F74|nr:acidic mammalian chitinase-like [Ctenocephalides felis]